MEAAEDVVAAIYRALSDRDELALGDLGIDTFDGRHVGPAGETEHSGFVTTVQRQIGAVVGWRPGSPTVHSVGDLAWAVDSPIVQLEGAIERTLRLTIVLRRAGATWQIVHTHLSVVEE